MTDLQRIYQLFKRLPNSSNACGLQPISQIVREHIVDVSNLLLVSTCIPEACYFQVSVCLTHFSTFRDLCCRWE